MQANILSGDDSKEDPPVPMPNTEVKLISANNTRSAGSREDRSTPAYTFKKTKHYALIAQLALRASAGGGRRSELEKVQRKGAIERK